MAKKTTGDLREDFYRFLKDRGYEHPIAVLSLSALRGLTSEQILDARKLLKEGTRKKRGPPRPNCPITERRRQNFPSYNYKSNMAKYIERFDYEVKEFYVHSIGLLEALANAFEDICARD